MKGRTRIVKGCRVRSTLNLTLAANKKNPLLVVYVKGPALTTPIGPEQVLKIALALRMFNVSCTRFLQIANQGQCVFQECQDKLNFNRAKQELELQSHVGLT